MSNVIDFLEKLASDARLLQAARDEVALALADAQVEATAGEAILARNVDELRALLNVAPLICFQTMPDEEEEEQEDEDGGESPEQKQTEPNKDTGPAFVVARGSESA